MSKLTMRMVEKTNWRTMVRIEDLLKGSMDDAVEEMANIIKEDVQSSWSGASPSAVGSPPAVVTGVLDDGVRVERTGRNAQGQFAKNGSVRFIQFDTSASGDGQYAGILEDPDALNRPFIEPAMERASALFGGVIKTSLKWR